MGERTKNEPNRTNKRTKGGKRKEENNLLGNVGSQAQGRNKLVGKYFKV